LWGGKITDFQGVDERIFIFIFPSNEKFLKKEKRKESQCKGVFISPQKNE
jgi:hypothetical protein